jgi:hypothetical protein
MLIRFTKTPLRFAAGASLRQGNWRQVTIKVINSWVNRLIGDQQPAATREYTFTAVKPYKVNSPLLHSGLIGPVSFCTVSAR